MNAKSSGLRFRNAMEAESPLQLVGAIHPLCALMAQQAGFRALYLSGAGVANASHGLPDLGVTSLHDVAEDARRITSVTDLPLIVDADTGWGTDLTIRRAVHEFEQAGVAGMHLEDQVAAKRCGHRPNKELVSTEEMQARLRAAIEARKDPNFVIIARTDAVAVEGIDAAIERSLAYVETGADVLFAEALTSLDQFRKFTQSVPIPVLANITEFGKTPMFTLAELRSAGVRIALYPLTAFRAMNAAATMAYRTLRSEGTQASIIDRLQTREELYELLNYYSAESKVRDLKL